ncbi:MAG TPA: hypothetical protein VH439_05800, partial [Gemmatimonadales bacterium]
MTFRWMVAVTCCLAACSGQKKEAAAGGGHSDSAGGAVAAATVKGTLPRNAAGKIPVLEYHIIGGDKNSLYTRTVASFRADLEDVYRRGYRPITIAQMLDKNFTDVP